MASGHVIRANRPNTWLHRPALHVKKTLASREPMVWTPPSVGVESPDDHIVQEAYHADRSCWSGSREVRL